MLNKWATLEEYGFTITQCHFMKYYDLTWGADESWLGDFYWEALWMHKNWFHKNVSETQAHMTILYKTKTA
jgi:hypothetical protein